MFHLCCHKNAIKDVGSMLSLLNQKKNAPFSAHTVAYSRFIISLLITSCWSSWQTLTLPYPKLVVSQNCTPYVRPCASSKMCFVFFCIFLNLTQTWRIDSDDTVTWVCRSKFHKMHALVCLWIHNMCPKYLISNSKPTRSIVLQVYDRVLSFRITPHIIFFLKTLRQLSRV